MLVIRRTDEQPIGRVNDGGGTAPGITAALLGRGLAAIRVIVRCALCKGTGRDGVVIVGMFAAGMIVLLALAGFGDCRMVLILRGRLRMARPHAARESKRNGNGQHDDSAAFHGIRP